MKRLIIMMLFLLGITVSAFSQERVKKNLELKNGTVISGYVLQQEDGSYMLETDTGDVLFYSSDEVRRVRSMQEDQLLNKGGKKSADMTSEVGLIRNYFSLVSAVTGDELRSSQVSDDFWNDYQKAAKKKKTGMWLMIGGGAIVATGSVLSSVLTTETITDSYDGGSHTHYESVGSSPVGLIVSIAGAGLAVFGAIEFFGGNSKLGNLAAKYNKEHGYTSTLYLDITNDGLTLAYRF